VLFSSRVHHELLLEFSRGWASDNGLTALSVRAGESVDSSQLIELCSGAKTLFSLATLVCRTQARILDCHRLWVEVLETFAKAQAAWSDVPTDCEPTLHFYLQQLERLRELTASRVDLYEISQSERLSYVRRHKSDFGEERTVKPNGNLNAEEQKIEAFLSLPF
jgi:hypothetical protein